ncbi:MAG: fibronectin type III domain-containing protein [Candidatus Omnitrophica bacterium]|nr:fibronectin type III domain-containing protein [Candidatus Omnitrophota bacterium]
MKIRKISLLLAVIILIGEVFIVSKAFCANTMATDSYSFTIVPDTTAPSAVTNLSITQALQNSITVAWTATGDDGSTGTASSYDIRYSTASINASNWASAAQVSGEPTPQLAGTTQSMTVSSLSAELAYYFAIKASDEAANISSLSNVVTTTTPDQTAPASVSNLAISSKTYDSVVLSWSAPGDDGSSGTASNYDIRYSTASINASNWASGTQVSGEPVPQVAGTVQTTTVSGLTASTTYFFAIKTTDNAANISDISNVPTGTTNAVPDTTPPYTTGHIPVKDASGISTDTNIIVHVKDDGAGVNVSSIVMTVNGQVVSPAITGTAADYLLSYNPANDFQAGQQIFVTIQASDLAP